MAILVFSPATEVPEIVQLVFKTELLAISSMPEVRSEHKICFGASLRHRGKSGVGKLLVKSDIR